MTTHEPIEVLLERSSLGRPAVRRLARRAPVDAVIRITAKALLPEDSRLWRDESATPAPIPPMSPVEPIGLQDPQTRRLPVARNERHVTQHPDGGWQVVKPGSERASARTETQAEAIDRAREILGNDGGGENVIHGRDGRIRDSDTVAPGNDPYPPKDRK